MRDGYTDLDDNDRNVDLEQYVNEAESHDYVEDLDRVDAKESEHFLNIGVDLKAEARAGTFIQKDRSVIHSHACQQGVEVLPISKALTSHSWLADYVWRNITPQKDEFTQRANNNPHEGYFIRTQPGAQIEHPVQSCLYIAKEGFSQNVHNVVIAEEGSNLQ